MSDHSSDYRRYEDEDAYEEVRQRVEEDGDTAAGERSVTRPPEEEDAAEEVPPPTSPPAHIGNGTYHYESNAYTRRHSGGAGEGFLRRSSSVRQTNPSVRRASSVHSIRSGDGRNILKDNHNSLIPDPQLQDLRRRSIVAASRYHSARRASSLSNLTGLGEAATAPAARTSCCGSATSSPHRRSRMTEAEAEALQIIAANDEHRLETYERAKEIDIERQCYVLDQEIQKHVKAESAYKKTLHERNAKLKDQRLVRERRTEGAWQRRDELDEERRSILEEKIARERDVPRDPYKTMVIRRRYSSLMRGSSANVIAPQRRSAAEDNSINDRSPTENGSRTSVPRSASRQPPVHVQAQHTRGWR